MEGLDPAIAYLLIGVVAFIVLVVFLSFFPVMLWISAHASGVRIGIITLVAMRLRRVVPSRIVNPMIKATKAGLGLTINQLESQQVRSHSLTDTKFLIGAQLANNALLQMRNQQSRTLLADTTYPAAKTLIQNIESTAPRSTKTMTSTATQPVTQAVAKRRPKPTYKKPVAKPVAKAKAAPKVAAPSSNNPFDSF